jgi:tetratricopeptide (TPR) repeat protein
MMLRTPAALLVMVAASLGVAGQSIPGTYLGNDAAGLRKAVEKDPENLGLRIRLTQALLRQDEDSAHPDRARARLKEAEGHFRKLLELDPTSVLPLRVLALDSYLSGRFEEAVELGKRLLVVAPWEADVARAVLKALLRLRKIEEAATFFVDWLEGGHTPSFGSIQGLIATLVLNPEMKEALEPRINDFVGRRSKCVEAFLYQAMFQTEVGRSETAWRTIHRAEELGLCETRTGSRHAFVRILDSRSPEFEEAPGSYEGGDVEQIQRIGAKNPKHAGLAMRTARLLDLSGRQEEAIAGYARVRTLNPDFWPAWYRPGQMLLESGRAADAAPLLSRASELTPGRVSACLIEAEAWVRAGDGTRARKPLLEIVRFHDPTEEVSTLLDLVRKKGFLDPVMEGMREALAKDPTNGHLKASLALALHRAGKRSEAQRMALDAERAGLVGKDAYPSLVLHDVFGVPVPGAPEGDR